jgi:hypothetical protein
MIKLNPTSEHSVVMRDRDIRAVLHHHLAELHLNEPDTLFVDELGLCQGESRIDIAVINGSLNGYEIKSEKDTLNRLPIQRNIYGKTLDTVTIVTSGCHLSEVLKIIPEWWGVIEVSANSGRACLEVIRDCQQNPDVDPYSMIQLLWRDEVLDELAKRGLERGVKGKPRPLLWKTLVNNLRPDEISAIVRHRLKNRLKWRVDQQP